MRQYENFEFELPLIQEPVEEDLKVIVIIPAFYEPLLAKTLNSLKQNVFNNGCVEIIIVINESNPVSKNITYFHKKQYEQLKTMSNKLSNRDIKFFPLYIKDIDKSVAGPGIARKIGMDEAVKRFDKINYQDGLIVNLDADSMVSPNYLHELIRTTTLKNNIKAFSIYFEHDINKDDITSEEKNAIIQYELHLRYYINMQRTLKLPYAYYTIGSAMAVRNFAYKEAFGMNKRQAGEDFYFLHKYIKTGYFAEINSTKVLPSARISNRVPFGTGKAINKIIESGKKLKTYNYRSFDSLNLLISNLEAIYSNYYNIKLLDKPISEFLKLNNFEKRYLEIKTNTSNFISFKKRFYRWFDAFLLMKYLHFARDNFFENIEVQDAASHLLKHFNKKEKIDCEEALMIIRKKDKLAEYTT